ncbi:MAG: hypothetical protein AMXMBFR46_22130 [Acidimicrobiia bacterium]
MDCEKTNRQVYVYLDGELTAFRRWQVTRHLSRCPPCQHGFAFELEVRRVVARRCQDEVPEELRRRIAEAIELLGETGAAEPGAAEPDE